MGTLYLVRHGQASFGAENYDQLSPLGQRQSQRLGGYFRSKGISFSTALSGTLRRQQQTLDGICDGMGIALADPSDSSALPAADGQSGADMPARLAHRLWPGLNEYDALAVIRAVYPHTLEKPDTPARYKHHFRLLQDGLAQWMAGVVSPHGMPSYGAFVAGVAAALAHVRADCSGNVLLVSSGGPIATAIGQVLGTAPEATIALNLGLRNSAVTEFHFTAKRHRLVTFNTLPHLDAPEHAAWITFA